MTKLTVVTNAEGVVIGTQLGHGDTPDPGSGIIVALAAGPGQTLHKVEYDVPSLNTTIDLESFHRELGERLRERQK